MTKEKFIREIKMQGVLHKIEQSAIEEAIKCFTEDDREYYPPEIESVIKFAQSSAHYIKEHKNLKMINLTPQTLVTSGYLCEKITPWVENVRQDIFGSSKPPFKDDIEKAVSWIHRKAKEPLSEKDLKKRQRILKKFDEIGTLIQGIPWTISWNRPILTFPGNKGYIEKVPADHPLELSNLEKVVNEMSKATGFEKYALTAFILTGIEPILSRVTVKHNNVMQTLPTGESLRRFNIAFDINSRDLTFEEIKELYDTYRKELRISKKKKITTKQMRLYYLVKEKGYPDKNKTIFWTDIAKQLGYKGWRQAYIDHKRIETKLDSQLL